MKKTYQNPSFQVSLVEAIDIIRTSDPYKEDQNWDLDNA